MPASRDAQEIVKAIEANTRAVNNLVKVTEKKGPSVTQVIGGPLSSGEIYRETKRLLGVAEDVAMVIHFPLMQGETALFLPRCHETVLVEEPFTLSQDPRVVSCPTCNFK